MEPYLYRRCPPPEGSIDRGVQHIPLGKEETKSEVAESFRLSRQAARIGRGGGREKRKGERKMMRAFIWFVNDKGERKRAYLLFYIAMKVSGGGGRRGEKAEIHASLIRFILCFSTPTKGKERGGEVGLCRPSIICGGERGERKGEISALLSENDVSP